MHGQVERDATQGISDSFHRASGPAPHRADAPARPQGLTLIELCVAMASPRCSSPRVIHRPSAPSPARRPEGDGRRAGGRRSARSTTLPRSAGRRAAWCSCCRATTRTEFAYRAECAKGRSPPRWTATRTSLTRPRPRSRPTRTRKSGRRSGIGNRPEVCRGRPRLLRLVWLPRAAPSSTMLDQEKDRVENAAQFSAFTTAEDPAPRAASGRHASRCGRATSASRSTAASPTSTSSPRATPRRPRSYVRQGDNVWTLAVSPLTGQGARRRRGAGGARIMRRAGLHPARDRRGARHPRRSRSWPSSTSTPGAVANHAYTKRLTVATLLARSKMTDLEQKLYDEGFSTDDDEESGDFSRRGLGRLQVAAKIIAPPRPRSRPTS